MSFSLQTLHTQHTIHDTNQYVLHSHSRPQQGQVKFTFLRIWGLAQVRVMIPTGQMAGLRPYSHAKPGPQSGLSSGADPCGPSLHQPHPSILLFHKITLRSGLLTDFPLRRREGNLDDSFRSDTERPTGASQAGGGRLVALEYTEVKISF